MLLVLIGGTCSGKSSVADELVKTYGYKKIIQDTTRPMRPGEVDGVDYNFVTEEEFLENATSEKYIEWNQFRGWYYGTRKDTIRSAAGSFLWNVLVANAPAAREIDGNTTLSFRVVYLAASQRTRAIRMLQRGDDLQEVFRRINFDDGQYANAEREFECTDNEQGRTVADVAKEIHDTEPKIW